MWRVILFGVLAILLLVALILEIGVIAEVYRENKQHKRK